MLDFYSAQSRFTDPGPMAGWLDGVGAGLSELREAASGLVFHYWGNGDITEHGFAPERLGEINLRYAEDMLSRLRELNPAAPGADRAATERVVGCCRDHTVLFLAMARHHGVPARARVGFAKYLQPGLGLDHVIAEVWDAVERRWRLVEPQLPTGYVDPADETELDLLDVPRDRFLVGADAWAACRSGAADPETFVVSPDLPQPFLRGLPYLRHNLVFDLAALNGHEMILWDVWGELDLSDQVDNASAARMDTLAALLRDPEATLAGLQAAFDRDGVRVPPVVTSYLPPGQAPVQVTLR